MPVVLSNIYVCKTEEDVVVSSKPFLYKHYVDDTYARRKKNEFNELYNVSKSYSQNIKLTLELDPRKPLIQRSLEVTTKLQLMCTNWKSSLYIGLQNSQWDANITLLLVDYKELRKLALKKRRLWQFIYYFCWVMKVSRNNSLAS